MALEKVTASQLIAYMSISDHYQSGFRALRSPETALIKVTNDFLHAADIGGSPVLVLLDLSTTFDAVVHSILLQETWVGLNRFLSVW